MGQWWHCCSYLKLKQNTKLNGSLFLRALKTVFQSQCISQGCLRRFTLCSSKMLKNLDGFGHLLSFFLKQLSQLSLFLRAAKALHLFLSLFLKKILLRFLIQNSHLRKLTIFFLVLLIRRSFCQWSQRMKMCVSSWFLYNNFLW